MRVVVWPLDFVFVIGLVIGLVIGTAVVMLFDFVPVIVGILNKLPPPIPIPIDNIIPPKITGGLPLPIRHKKEPAQQLFPFYGRIAGRPKLRARKSYFAFPDLLNENEYQFATGKRAHALKITPKNAKIYNRMFSQTLGMNILTQEQLKREKHRKSRHRNRLF